MRNFFILFMMMFSALTFATTTNVNAQIYGKWVLPCTIYGSNVHSPYLLTFDQTGLQLNTLSGSYFTNKPCEFSSGGYDVFKNVQFYTLGTEIHYGNSNDHINYITTPYLSLVPEYQIIPKPRNTDKYFTFITGINIGFLRNIDFHFDYNEITMANGVPQDSNLISIRSGIDNKMIDSIQITQLDCSNDTSGQIVIYPLGRCCYDQCTIYCIFSDGTVIPFDWNENDHYFFNVVDLWQGTYTYTITCGPSSATNTFTIGIDYSHYLDENGMFTISTDLTIPSNNFPFYNYKFMNGIRVTNNAVLTLNGELFQFDENAKVIIEPGGKLLINNSVFTSHCDSIWQGIEVWGNSAKSQYPDQNGIYSQGYLKLDNNSVIENAVCAVDLWKPDDWSATGGIVHSNNTNFINCTKSVHALYYKNYNPNDPNKNELPYNAIFKLDTFEITSSYSGNNRFYKHVDLSDVKGVNFKGCSFSIADNVNNVSTWNIGIAGYNAGYTVTDYCSNGQIAPCPESDLTHSSFTGFYCGVRSANAAKPLNFISIYNADFINNGYGIYFENIFDPVIVGNTFKLGTFDCYNCGELGIGVYLDNSKMFAVENNDFMLTQNPPPAQYIGIRTINTNNNYDEIYRNSFDGMSVANFAEGKNFGTSNLFGLAYYCNQNQNNHWDFDVEKITGVYYNDIQRFQGGENYSAGNTFSVNANSHFYNNGDDTISYYYDNGTPSQAPSLLYRVTPEPLQLINNCPTHYGNGNSIKLNSTEYKQREIDYSSNSVLYDNAKSLYDNSSYTTIRNYRAGKISYYYGEMARAAYDIIRSNLVDTVAHPDRFKSWMEKLNTYTSAESMVDFYLQQGDYTTALNKVDSLPYRFTFTAYDSVEYPLYKSFKQLQTTWLADGRTIFDLTGTEINSLIAIADSSKGTAGAQARGILLYAYDSLYSYADCPNLPDSTYKSGRITGDSNTGSNDLIITTKPNPANNQITFVYTLPYNTQTAVLSLYNSNGKLVYKNILNGNKNELKYNCSHLNQGVYYYTVYSENGKVTGKIIIVR